MAVVSIAFVLVLASFASANHAKKPTQTFAAVLNIGGSPHPTGTKLGASGKFTVTVSGTTLAWKLTFGRLSGSATAAHIHSGVKARPGRY